MTVGSLFSGIGGLDLGFERAGFVIRWQCEADEFCRRALKKHWPDVPCYPDVRTLTAETVEPVDVLIGGFPCQDVSDAGLRTGIDGARSGLWSEYARLIRELRPRYVAIENVPGLFARGMDRVLGDLAALGMDAEWEVIRASDPDVGAPHRRARVFILAYANVDRRDVVGEDKARQPRPTRSATGASRELWSDGRRRSVRSEGRAELADANGGRRREYGSSHDNDWRDASRHDVDGCDSRELVNTANGLQRHGQENDAAPITGREEQQAIAGGSSETRLADAASLFEGEGREQRTGDHAARLRGETGAAQASLADADSGRLGVSDEPRHAARFDQGLADTARIGQKRNSRVRRQARRGVELASGERGTDTDATRPAIGDPRFWPARPGQPQHAWEPPRCLESSVGRRTDGVSRGLAGWRRAALQAFGNAVVPQVAEVVAWRVRALMEAQ